jgi:PAS domain-containing protein
MLVFHDATTRSRFAKIEAASAALAAALRKAALRAQAGATLASDLDQLRQRASQAFALLLWFHVAIGALVAYSNRVPLANVIPIMTFAAIAGTIAAFCGSGLAARLTIAAALTVGPAMMVYAGRGPWQTDWHMYFFVIFGMLVVYVDWRPIALSAALTAAHHLLLDLLFPGAVFPEAGLGRVVLHAAIVAVDCAVLFSIVSLVQELFAQTASSLRAARVAAAEAQRLESYAKHGSDLIMQAVNQGLLLCDSEYRIQPQYSSELERIFETKELAGRNILELLQGLLGERLHRTASDYFAMLFDPQRKERTVLRVNPLSEAELSFWDHTGRTFTPKFLNFSFRRIVEDGVVVRVFVAVNDITERVMLERQLSDAERQKDRQVELLFGLLHIERRALDEFIAMARTQIRAIGDMQLLQGFAAAGSGHRELLLTRLDATLSSLHAIESSAALIKFTYFQRRAREFETNIAEVRNHAALRGDDFLALSFVQSELRCDLQELEELRAKFPRALQPEIAPSPSARPSDDVVAALDAFAASLAQRLGKDVRLDAGGFDTRALPEARRMVVSDVLKHLARNSIMHGIEAPGERQACSKDRRATLTIRRAESDAGEFGFTFRDDGRGLDLDRIRDCAIAKRMIARDSAAAMTDEQIASLIFKPGFSTVPEPDADCGHGTGMSVMCRTVIEQCGGHIEVASEQGHYCEFTILLPVRELVHA